MFFDRCGKFLIEIILFSSSFFIFKNTLCLLFIMAIFCSTFCDSSEFFVFGYTRSMLCKRNVYQFLRTSVIFIGVNGEALLELLAQRIVPTELILAYHISVTQRAHTNVVYVSFTPHSALTSSRLAHQLRQLDALS